MVERFYPESRFGGFTSIDGTVAFYTRVQALAGDAACTIVDFGCGRALYQADPLPFRRSLRILRAPKRRVIGLDAAPAGAGNPYLDEFIQLNGPRWPLDDCSADLVLCDNVLEHLPQPAGFFSEAQRVLRPGGYLCIRTPNRWNYIAILSRLVPNRAHARLLAQAKPGLQEQDVFPTYYRCNTLPALRRALRESGFDAAVLGYEAEPSYLSFSAAAYLLGMLHQKLAPPILRAAIFAFGQKK